MSQKLETGALKAFALRSVLVVVVLKSALNLSVANRYGWHRDELYYAVAGRHLQGGYVEFPPLTALFAALSRLFGNSLVGLRGFVILAGAVVVVLAALIARELGGGARAQVLAAVLVAFSPILITTNGLFQPVSLDQLTTLLLLFLALRLALGRGNWLLIGLAAGVGLETKYTLAVLLSLLLVAFLVFRRDLLRSRGFLLAAAVASALMIPNLIWQAGHGWASLHFFTNPPPSASAESRPQFVGNLFLLSGLVALPVAVAGLRLLARDRALRALAWAVVGTILAYFVLNGKSYYLAPVVFFALAAGSVPLDRWLSSRRLWAGATAFGLFGLAFLPFALPVLPLETANRLGVLEARSDYESEVGWPGYVEQVRRASRGADVIIAMNYGEAGALQVLGHDLPPVASGNVTYRYWRPDVAGRQAVVVGFDRRQATFCGANYRVVARIEMPVANEERGRPIARCSLDGSLAAVWPRVLALYD
ncbi:MAG: glycosyltransferase family 39 protein [Gaiellaceae bacterium]